MIQMYLKFECESNVPTTSSQIELISFLLHSNVFVDKHIQNVFIIIIICTRLCALWINNPPRSTHAYRH